MESQDASQKMKQTQKIQIVAQMMVKLAETEVMNPERLTGCRAVLLFKLQPSHVTAIQRVGKEACKASWIG